MQSSGIRYNVYYEDGNFAQMYSLQLGEEKADKWARLCCDQMHGCVKVEMSNGIEMTVYENFSDKSKETR